MICLCAVARADEPTTQQRVALSAKPSVVKIVGAYVATFDVNDGYIATNAHVVSDTATGIVVGRQPGVAHVLVNDHRASGKHVWIGIVQGQLVAIDQCTTNGTYINDLTRGRIARAELRDGDVVIVGEPDCCSLQVRLG
jgi:hypothetical protein